MARLSHVKGPKADDSQESEYQVSHVDYVDGLDKELEKKLDVTGTAPKASQLEFSRYVKQICPVV